MAPHCTLHLALVDPLDAPNCSERGVMWAGIATSRPCDSDEEGAAGANSTSLTAGERPQVQLLQAPEGAAWRWWQLGYSGILGGGGTEDVGEYVRACHKNWYRPSTSDTTTVDSIFCTHLSPVSEHLSSKDYTLLNNPRP